MNTHTNKIIATIIVLPFLGMTSLVSADFDCTDLDRDNVMEVMQKQKDGETLTTTEQTLLTNAQTCMPKRGNEYTGSGQLMGERADMTDEQKAEMKEVQALIKKQKDGETLTTAEQTRIDAALPKGMKVENIGMDKKQGTVNTSTFQVTKTYSGLNTAYKKKIDSAFEKILSNISGYSETKQLTRLNTLNTKIETLQTKIKNTSSYSTNKKTVYNSIFDYLSDKIQTEIDEINGDEEVDDIFADLFE